MANSYTTRMEKVKMKIGDLVRLSNYGVKRSFNKQITTQDPYQIGIIVSLYGNYAAYPYKVRWTKLSKYDGSFHTHSRREIKHAKKTN